MALDIGTAAQEPAPAPQAQQSSQTQKPKVGRRVLAQTDVAERLT